MVKSATKPRRRNGEGSITEDKVRGRWRGFVAWTEPDGTPRRKSFSGPSADDVRQKVTALRAALDVGRRPATPRTVGEYLSGWLDAERARIRPATWLYRAGHVNRYIVPAMGTSKIADVTPRDIERMTTAMVDKGLAPRTAAGARTTLRKALADAQRDGLVHRNVAALARPPRIPGRAVEYLDRAELRKLLVAAESDPLGPLVIVAATTGLRQGELLGLTWADVDMLGATVTVRHSMSRDWSGGYSLSEPKTTRSRRTIHLPDRAGKALLAQQVLQAAERLAAGEDVWDERDDLVFTDHVGRAITPSAVSRRWRSLNDAAGIKRVPFHALRHSWATLALASGVPLKVISDNLGHTSITVTAQFYSGIVPELNRDAADAVGRALE